MLDRLKRWWLYAITVSREPFEPDKMLTIYIVRRWSGERVAYIRRPISWLTESLPLAPAWCRATGIPAICVSHVEKKLRLLAGGKS